MAGQALSAGLVPAAQNGSGEAEPINVDGASELASVGTFKDDLDAPAFVPFDSREHVRAAVVVASTGMVGTATPRSTALASGTAGSAEIGALSQDGEPASASCRGAATFDDTPALVTLTGSADPRMCRAPRPQAYPPPQRHAEFHREELPVQADISATGNPPVSVAQTHRPRHRTSQRRDDSGSGDSGSGGGDPDPEPDGFALSFVDRAPFFWRFRALRCRFMEWREGVVA